MPSRRYDLRRSLELCVVFQMSASMFLSFGLLTVLAFISLSSTYHPVGGMSLREQANDSDDLSSSNEDTDMPRWIDHAPRSLAGHNQIRPSRNSWFRASSYQNMKPAVEPPEVKTPGDSLLRWG